MLTVEAAGRPTVAIHDLTISGGVTTASGRCATVCGHRYADATALGGGIAVPPAADGSTRATVTVADAAATQRSTAHGAAVDPTDSSTRPASPDADNHDHHTTDGAHHEQSHHNPNQGEEGNDDGAHA